MNSIIVSMPITEDALKWAHLNYPEFIITQYSSQRNNYLLLSRALLQKMLSHFFAIHKLPMICYEEYGKPYFKDMVIHFNISHTKNQMIIILSDQGPVGIDIEMIKHRKHFKQLEERVLNPQEIIWLNNQQNYLPSFFQLWSAKEAYLKATGRGLAGLSNLSLNMNQNFAIGPLKEGYLYIQQDCSSHSLAIYLPSQLTLNLYQFNGELFARKDVNQWHILACQEHS